MKYEQNLAVLEPPLEAPEYKWEEHGQEDISYGLNFEDLGRELGKGAIAFSRSVKAGVEENLTGTFFREAGKWLQYAEWQYDIKFNEDSPLHGKEDLLVPKYSPKDQEKMGLIPEDGNLNELQVHQKMLLKAEQEERFETLSKVATSDSVFVQIGSITGALIGGMADAFTPFTAVGLGKVAHAVGKAAAYSSAYGAKASSSIKAYQSVTKTLEAVKPVVAPAGKLLANKHTVAVANRLGYVGNSLIKSKPARTAGALAFNKFASANAAEEYMIHMFRHTEYPLPESMAFGYLTGSVMKGLGMAYGAGRNHLKMRALRNSADDTLANRVAEIDKLNARIKALESPEEGFLEGFREVSGRLKEVDLTRSKVQENILTNIAKFEDQLAGAKAKLQKQIDTNRLKSELIERLKKTRKAKGKAVEELRARGEELKKARVTEAKLKNEVIEAEFRLKTARQTYTEGFKDRAITRPNPEIRRLNDELAEAELELDEIHKQVEKTTRADLQTRQLHEDLSETHKTAPGFTSDDALKLSKISEAARNNKAQIELLTAETKGIDKRTKAGKAKAAENEKAIEKLKRDTAIKEGLVKDLEAKKASADKFRAEIDDLVEEAAQIRAARREAYDIASTGRELISALKKQLKNTDEQIKNIKRVKSKRKLTAEESENIKAKESEVNQIKNAIRDIEGRIVKAKKGIVKSAAKVKKASAKVRAAEIDEDAVSYGSINDAKWKVEQARRKLARVQKVDTGPGYAERLVAARLERKKAVEIKRLRKQVNSQTKEVIDKYRSPKQILAIRKHLPISDIEVGKLKVLADVEDKFGTEGLKKLNDYALGMVQSGFKMVQEELFPMLRSQKAFKERYDTVMKQHHGKFWKTADPTDEDFKEIFSLRDVEVDSYLAKNALDVEAPVIRESTLKGSDHSFDTVLKNQLDAADAAPQGPVYRKMYDQVQEFFSCVNKKGV